MKRLLLAALMLLFSSVPALAAFQQEQWQFFKEIRAQKNGFTLITTDKDILGHSHKGLGDLRLTAEDGREIPYQVVRQERPKEDLYPVTIINLLTLADSTSLTLDLSKPGLLHNQIVLDIKNSEDYLRDVLLEGSNDNRTWSAVTLKDKLFYVPPDIKKNNLSYTPASFRYMRLTIDCKGKKPLNINGARVKYSSPVENFTPALLPQTQKEKRTDPKTNITEIFIDLGTAGYQVDQINLLSGLENFNRLVEIYESDDAREWSLMASERIYHYRWEGYQSQNNIIKLGQASGRYIKAEVHNQDSPPPGHKAQVYGESPKLLASLSPGKYTLWYGNPRSAEPLYDLTQFSHLINRSALETVTPGPEQANPSYEERISPQTTRLLLNAAVILAAVVIGFIILKNMRSRSSQ
ncbi:MAG: DUF3999 domain-containing protein [Firmicutes bacterium]|nr:DUF3999 domain-containing protein [Bacillota bacterium]